MPDAEPAVAEPAVAEPEPVAAERDTEAPYDLNARRRDVHERTRSAIDELS